MRELVRGGRKNPTVRQLAVALTRNLQQKDWYGEILALFEFVRDKIRYVKDVRTVETLHTPVMVLENGQGDCDDKTVLLASLLESLGHKTRLVAIGFAPEKYSHVYPEVFLNGKWISLETTEPVELGWRAPNIKSSLILSV